LYAKAKAHADYALHSIETEFLTEVRMFPQAPVAFVSLFLMLVNPPAPAAERTPTDLVLVEQGTLPIILTAPHSGREAIPGVLIRNAHDKVKVAESRSWGGFDTHDDANTDILTQDIAVEIEKLTGKKPYLVIAKFERRYIDANRPPDIGLDDPTARPYYDYYHNSIRRFIDDIRGKYPAGLLIDVHGQRKDPEVQRHAQRPHSHPTAEASRRAGCNRVERRLRAACRQWV
jgi:hypothetical protein